MLLLMLLASHVGTKYKCKKFCWVCDCKATLSTNVDKRTKVHDEHCRRQPENVDLLSQIWAMKGKLNIQVANSEVGKRSSERESRPYISQCMWHGIIKQMNWPHGLGTIGEPVVIWGRKLIILFQMNAFLCKSKAFERQVGKVEDCIRFHIDGYHLRCYLQSRHH